MAVGVKSWRWSEISVPFRYIACATVSLPLGGFLFCIFWALYSDFESATRTHCDVKNYLPSLSAAIGGFPLSARVWKWCIGLQAIPRFIVTNMYYDYLKKNILVHQGPWISFVRFLSIMENVGLIGLTFVSSKDNYHVHERFFYMFMLASELYMLIMCALLMMNRRTRPSTLAKKSLRCKWILVTLNLLCFAIAGYAFVQHNVFCEPGMYTLFALMEYLVVLTNMGFHMTAYWDFFYKSWTIGPC